MNDTRPVADGSRWGDWILRSDNQTLEFIGEAGWYEIDLEDITDSARMLDWIFQVQHKPWVTDAIMGDLLRAFHDIFHPRAKVFSGGLSLHV